MLLSFSIALFRAKENSFPDARVNGDPRHGNTGETHAAHSGHGRAAASDSPIKRGHHGSGNTPQLLAR